MVKSPAQKGSLQVGDIILKVGDRTINNYTDLVDEVGKTAIGKTLKIEVLRKKEKVNLFITIAERS